MKWSLQALLFGLVAIAGVAAACEGLSPGDQMTTEAGSCTLAFVFASPTDLYFATAGHCIQVDEPASNPDVGEFGKGAFHFLDPETGGPSDGSPGMDFGLIRIDPAVYDQINPKVCGWDGPLGLYDGSAEGGGVKHFGHGVVFGDAGPTTQKREGFFLRSTDEAFYFTGLGVPGDSGSAVLSENDLAVGVFTHFIAGVGVPPEDNGGTRLERGLALAAAEGFTNLRLVLAGEDPVAVMREMAGTPPTSTMPAPTPATPAAKPTPAPSSPPAKPSSSTAEPAENDSIEPANADAADDAPMAAKDTPFLGAHLVLALSLALALALRKK